MEKQYFVFKKSAKAHATYEDAEKAAKQMTVNPDCYRGGQEEYVIAKAVAYTNTPVPSIEVTKLS